MYAVSVIITTMGRSNMVLRLLRNLSDQVQTPDEVIIVESGEIDWRNIRLPQSVTQSYVFKNAPGASLTKAREIGRKTARGDLLIFLDDDVLIPQVYIQQVCLEFNRNPQLQGLGGAYTDDVTRSSGKFKKFLGRAFGIYSDGKRNKILKSGWADYVRGRALEEDTHAQWLFGCNWAVRATLFNHEKIYIETDLERWSFLEDVILGNRITKNLGNVMKISCKLNVLHAPSQSAGKISRETIRMRILYRYIFWRFEITNGKFLDDVYFCSGTLAGFLLLIKDKPCIDTFVECMKSYIYILKQKPKSYKDCNQFIFSE